MTSTYRGKVFLDSSLRSLFNRARTSCKRYEKGNIKKEYYFASECCTWLALMPYVWQLVVFHHMAILRAL